MNDATRKFIESLKARSDVLGVILFGSWARGNNRPDSDADLVVIVTEGYKKAVEEKDGQVFDICLASFLFDFYSAKLKIALHPGC